MIMTVSELLLRHSFDEIVSAFCHLFKVNSHHMCSEQELSEWKRLYNHLAMLQPSPNTTRHIRLVSRWEHCSPRRDMNCSVYDSSDNLIVPLADYNLESNILGMTVAIDDDVEITEAELVSGLFWELTYRQTKDKELIINEKTGMT